VHSVSAAYSAALANHKVRMCELVDVLLSSGITHRITNHSKDIVWNAAGDTYSALLPDEYRGPITFNTGGGFDEFEISLGNVSGDIADNIKKHILEAAKITVRLIRWDATYAADEQITLFVGVPDVSWNAKSLSLRIVSEMDCLNITVPRHCYQPGCNYYLFDTGCGLTRSDYAYAGTAADGSETTMIDPAAGTLYKVAFDGGDEDNPVEIGDALVGSDGTPGAGVCVNIVYVTAATGYIWYLECTHQFVNNEVITGGGNTVTVNGTPAEDTTLYEQGELEMLTGDNAGHCRPVLSATGGMWTVFWPFPNAIVSTDTYKLYPGCDGKASTCKYRFDNDERWRGFPYGPRVEDTML